MGCNVYRAGIIGLGFIGYHAPDSHLTAYMYCHNTMILGLCDSDKEKIYLCKFIAGDMTQYYTDYRDMVARDIFDIVSVETTSVVSHNWVVELRHLYIISLSAPELS